MRASRQRNRSAARSARVAASAFGVPKMALPATRMEAPAATTAAALVGSMPPSISIGADEPARDEHVAHPAQLVESLCG